MLAPLLDELRSRPLIELQENYVATFDRSPSHSLHLFEHVHGESRDRGQAMVDLMDEYRRDGFEPLETELPDYVPLFLEFLGALSLDGKEERAEQCWVTRSTCWPPSATAWRARKAICRRLQVLRTLTDVQPSRSRIRRCATWTKPWKRSAPAPMAWNRCLA
jgi:nitrate reductase delta subunit